MAKKKTAPLAKSAAKAAKKEKSKQKVERKTTKKSKGAVDSDGEEEDLESILAKVWIHAPQDLLISLK
jgi:hypothetical protein